MTFVLLSVEGLATSNAFLTRWGAFHGAIQAIHKHSSESAGMGKGNHGQKADMHNVVS